MPNRSKNPYGLRGPFVEVPTEAPIQDGKWHTGSLTALHSGMMLGMKGKSYEDEMADFARAKEAEMVGVMRKAKVGKPRKLRKPKSKWKRFKQWLRKAGKGSVE